MTNGSNLNQSLAKAAPHVRGLKGILVGLLQNSLAYWWPLFRPPVYRTPNSYVLLLYLVLSFHLLTSLYLLAWNFMALLMSNFMDTSSLLPFSVCTHFRMVGDLPTLWVGASPARVHLPGIWVGTQQMVESGTGVTSFLYPWEVCSPTRGMLLG